MYLSIPQDPIVLSAGAAFVSFTKRSRKLRPFSSFSAAPYLLASLGLNVWAILGLSLSVLFRASRSFMGLGFRSFRRIFFGCMGISGLGLWDYRVSALALGLAWARVPVRRLHFGSPRPIDRAHRV